MKQAYKNSILNFLEAELKKYPALASSVNKVFHELCYLPDLQKPDNYAWCYDPDGSMYETIKKIVNDIETLNSLSFEARKLIEVEPLSVLLFIYCFRYMIEDTTQRL